MISFVICKDINDENKIWNIIRDPFKIPTYWKGTRELNIKEVQDHVYEGTVKFAFPSSGRVRITVNENERKVQISYLSGPITGTHEIYIQDNKLCSKWNVKLSIFLMPMEKRTEEHFKLGTEHALERIVSE